MTAASVNGITIEYELHGEGEPLILVMGLGNQLIAWPLDFVNRIAERGFQVIRFDNRDVGLSSEIDAEPATRRKLAAAVVARKRAKAPYRIADMADDTAGLLGALGIARAHVVGASMGGMIAQSLAIRHPATVGSLVSIMSNAGDRRHGRPKPALLAKVARLQAHEPGEVADVGAQTFRLISGPHYDEADIRTLADQAVARHFDEAGTARQLMAILASPDRTPELARLDVPTLVIHGLLDPLVRPSGGVATAKAIPGSRLLMFPDMGHDLPRVRWDEIIDAIVANARRGGFRDPGDTPMTRTRVIVAGLGAMGSAAADELAGRGVEVVALEAFGPGHTNGSSHGPTRIVRRIIEEAPFYVPLVLDAFARWAALEADCRERLIVPSGVIRIAPPESDLHRMFRDTAVAWDLPFEELTPAEVMARFPGFAVPDGYAGLFEADGGFVLAARALEALRGRAERRGAVLRFNEPVVSWSADASGVVVTTATDRYQADALVLATGAWTARLAADLGLPLEANRVVNASFAPPDPAVYGPSRFPAFIVADDRPGLGGTPALRGDGIYGVPYVPGEGLKVGAGGTPVDPDHVDRAITEAEVEVLRSWVARFLPGAVGPVMSTLTCLYVKTPDEHFVIGAHPGHDNVVVASPCSGHGFKYTPAIGAVLADLALGVAPAHDLTPFAPTRF